MYQINSILILSAIMLISGCNQNPKQQGKSQNQQYSSIEPGEQFPGGATTHRKKINKNAFSHGSANMSFEKELDFKIGNGVFRRLWVSAPASTQAADGLGPLFNARSCERCHLKDGRGHPPTENGNDNAISMFLRLSIPPQNQEQQQLIVQHKQTVIPEPTYGGQLQDFSIQGHPAEGKMKITYTEQKIALADGELITLRKPDYSINRLAYGHLHPDTLMSPRVAPQMIGLGLLEAIHEDNVLSYADPDDRDGDGISGKPNRVWSQEFNKVMLGRFGWKAGSPSVNEQSQAAFAGDMGISVPLFPNGAGECTDKQKDCQQTPNGNSPQYENLESGLKMTDLTVFYSRNLAVPMRRNYNAPEVLKGKKIFYETGCQHCHRPQYMTRKDSIGKEQSEQLIWPYTDLLLHDMGDGLADNRPEGEANGKEWRTPPLWGIGLTPIVNNHSFYLHDGRARNLLEAILWHGGEAEPHKQKVIKMSKQDRKNLLTFINSL